MRARHVLLALLALWIGLEAGYRIGSRTQAQKDQRRAYILNKRVQRFENPAVFHHAEKVARLTHTPLYQILTGRLDR